MAVINGRSKRVRVTAVPRPLELRSFPAAAEGLPPRGAFRDCVRSFLAGSAVPADGAWQVAFEVGNGAVVVMEVVEEDVAKTGIERIYCDHCTVAGE